MTTNKMSNDLHNNKNYSVTLSDSDEFNYDVYNNITGVVEHQSKTLPEAIEFAEHSNAYIDNALWTWINRKGREMAQDDGDLEVDLDGGSELH